MANTNSLKDSTKCCGFTLVSFSCIHVSIIETNAWDNVFGESTISYGMPKFFNIPEKSLVGLHDVELLLTVSNSPFYGPHVDIDNFGLLTGSKDFGWAVPVAAKVGANFAQEEIRKLFENSDFFRAALAEPKLKNIAEDISIGEEQRKAGKDYPFWKFRLDTKRLVDAAKEAGLTEAYADDYFKNYEENRMNGTLFWTYHNNKGFMLQWICAGLTFLIISQITIQFKNKHLRIWSMGITLAAILGVNALVFSRMSGALTIRYWILPGILFLTAGLPLSWKLYTEASRK